MPTSNHFLFRDSTAILQGLSTTGLCAAFVPQYLFVGDILCAKDLFVYNGAISACEALDSSRGVCLCMFSR